MQPKAEQQTGTNLAVISRKILYGTVAPKKGGALHSGYGSDI